MSWCDAEDNSLGNCVRENGVSRHYEGAIKGHPETPRNITAVWYRGV